jgi:rare lipoprotein A (peptidoglycan hydrolase)
VFRGSRTNSLGGSIAVVGAVALLAACITIAAPHRAVAAISGLPGTEPVFMAPRAAVTRSVNTTAAVAASDVATVPSVYKYSGKTAIARLRAAGFKVYVAKPRYDAKVKKYLVSAQVLKAGSTLKKGRTITIYPSLGAKPVISWKYAKASVYGGPGESQGTAGSYAGCGTTRSLERYGILYFAHKSMPFGTKVQFSYRGRTVTGVCVDRGPYVGGRTFDLGHNTAAALNFGGVGTVAWSIVK